MLLSFLFFLCVINLVSSSTLPHWHEFSNSTTSRHLTSQLYRIKIKIPGDFSQKLLSLTIQDACTVSSTRFSCEGVSSTQIPSPIHNYFSNTPGTEQFLEYSGYFQGPITIDLSYLNQNYFLEYLYNGLSFGGSPIISVNNLSNTRSTGYVSSYFYGYVKSQATGDFALEVTHDDECIVYWNDSMYVKDEIRGNYIIRGPTMKMTQGEFSYFSASLKNSGMGNYGLWLSWNTTGTFQSIPKANLYFPTRIQGAPLTLKDLKRNYFCEVINGLKCKECDWLCIECATATEEITCKTCVQNAHILSNLCYCNEGYYQDLSLKYECKECPALCKPCHMDEVSQDIVCQDCPALCKSCYLDEVNQVVACKECEENTNLVGNECLCMDGFFVSNSDTGGCKSCKDGLCKTCEGESGEICRECKENAEMMDECVCRLGYTESDELPTVCIACSDQFCMSCDNSTCQKCFTPRSLDSTGSCICLTEHYDTIDEVCIYKPFTVNLTSSLNSILIKFSKTPSEYLSSTSYTILILLQDLSSLLSHSLTVLSSTEYELTFSCPYTLLTQSLIQITFSDTVQDSLGNSLTDQQSSTEVSFSFSGGCVSVFEYNSCQACIASNTMLSSCDKCDSSCRCISLSWTTCQDIVPYVENAVWYLDMLGFYVKFNVQIWISMFKNNECEQYLESDSYKELGNGAVCKWDEDQEALKVSIGVSSSITTGPIKLKNNVIGSAYNQSMRYSSYSGVSITVPIVYPLPTASLNVPTIISYCNDLNADGSSSFGNRRTLTYAWSVSGENSDSISQINDFLKNENGSTITISNKYLNNLSSLTLTLTVKNTFQQFHTVTGSISISKKFVPEVLFQGGSQVEIITTTTYSPQIILKWPTCMSLPISYETIWTLDLISNPSKRRLQLISNKQSVTISAGSLKADSTYSVKVRVIPSTQDQDAIESSSILTITTLPAPIQVKITRGNRQATISRETALDGSSSYDPDNLDDPLTYSWYCTIDEMPCNFINTLPISQSLLVIPPNTMLADRIYTFYLTVTSHNKSASSSVYLKTTSLYIPEVYLFTNAGYLNPYYIIFANNELSQVQSLQLKWSVQGGPYLMTSPTNQRSITFKENTLEYGTFYTFSLEVSLEDLSTVSTISLYVNTPPLYGKLEITPIEGRELDTFKFITNEWEDVENNYPIKYELHKDANNLMIKVTDMNYSNVFTGVLAAGDSMYNYSRSYYIKAYDSLGAYSITSFNVTVIPIDEKEVESIVYNTIKYMKDNLEVIESVNTIPYTLITMSDSLLKQSNLDQTESRNQFVKDCLYLLSYYADEEMVGNQQADIVISTLERVTVQPDIVTEYSRNETVRLFNDSLVASEGGLIVESIQQAVQVASNLYISSETDSTISIKSKKSNSLSYHTILNNLGLSVVRNQIRNQDYSEIVSPIYQVLYQRVSPSYLSSNFSLPKGEIIFPESISPDFSYDDIIDLSLIYTQDSSFTNYSQSFNETLYYLKNAGVMYLDAKHTGYENEVGDVVYEPIETIKLSNLTEPIQILITAEYINITDQSPQCVFLNESSMVWETTGCEFKGILEDRSQIICECNHMSFYSVSDLQRDLIHAAEPNHAEDLNPTNLLNAKIEDCYSVLIVMIVIVILHAVLSFYVSKMDQKDRAKPIELIPETVEFKERHLSKYKTASNLSQEAQNINNPESETPKDLRIDFTDDKPLKLPSSKVPIHIEGLYMVSQEVELQYKTFSQLYILSHNILELKYIRNHSLSKLSRLSLLFYSIYANIFILGFFYTLEDDETFQEQLKQIRKAMQFDAQDVILFIYTKLVVIGPLICIKWLLSRDIKTLDRTVKNVIGICVVIVGYLGCIMGIILLGVNFSVIYM